MIDIGEVWAAHNVSHISLFTCQSSGSGEQPSRDTDPHLPGESSKDTGDEDEAKRLAEEANKLMDAARAELQLEEEMTKRGAEKDAAIYGRLAQLQGVQPVENTGKSFVS